MFGKKKRMIEQQRQRIAELEEQVKGLTAQNDSFNARIAEVEQRESGIGRAISEATVTADRMIGDAQRKAGAMLEQAQQDTDAAKRDAERLVDDAYRNARDIVKEAETEGERKLGEVQERIDTYASLLQEYDRMVQEQIAIAQENARRFAELSRALHEAVPQILSAEGKLLEPAASEPFEAEQLPEPELIANRLDNELIRRGEMLPAKVIADTLDLPLLGEVPEDPAVYRSILRHGLITDYDCPARGAVLRIAGRMLGKEIPFPAYGTARIPLLRRLFHNRLKEVTPLDRH